VRRVALVCGGAAGVWEERREAMRLLAKTPHAPVAVAVNGAGAQHPDPLDHWVTIHPEDFRQGKGWEHWRRDAGLRDGYTRWSQSRHPHADRILRGWAGGSSGWFAVGVALQGLECAGVILCGIPLDASPNVTDPQWAGGWDEYRAFRYEWTKHSSRKRVDGRVRSWSGWTRDLLGTPDESWLAAR
jgi:hypothetical protein